MQSAVKFNDGKMIEKGYLTIAQLLVYEPELVARVRTEYLHVMQRKYESEIAHMDMILEADVAQSGKTKAKKRKEKLYKQLLECREYDQVIAHIANKKIALDLDDGVKVNYAKFQAVKLAQGDTRATLKRDVLKKI